MYTSGFLPVRDTVQIMCWQRTTTYFPVAGRWRLRKIWIWKKHGTMGASVSTYIPVFGKTLNVNAEYYYTDFRKQVVVDMDSNPHEVAFYNLDGRSYSHVFPGGSKLSFLSKVSL